MIRNTDAWIQTYSGKQLYFDPPDPADIDPIDVAHMLAGLNRYNNATETPYTVAQHCVMACDLADKGFELPALLHDAHEYIVGDSLSPVKAFFGHDYFRLVVAIDEAIANRFGFHWTMFKAPHIREIDVRLLLTERRDIMKRPPALWNAHVESHQPYEFTIEPWPWAEAERRFLDRLSKFGVSL